MDLYTAEVIGSGLLVLTNVVWIIGLLVVAETLHNDIEQIEERLDKFAKQFGYSFRTSGWNDREYLSVDDDGKLPASHADVERFFEEHEERLNAVYKHLGIKLGEKVTPATPEKHEVVVEKLGKK